MSDPITQLCNFVLDLIKAEWQNLQAGCHRPDTGSREERIQKRVERYQQREQTILELRRLMASAAAGIQANVGFETVEGRLSDLLEVATALTQWERRSPRREPGGVAFLDHTQQRTEYQQTDSLDDQAEEILAALTQAAQAKLAAVKNLAIAFADPNADLGRSLEIIFRAAAVEISVTKEFRDQKHDQLLECIQKVLVATLPDHPQVTILQSMQDRGCDLLIEWPQHEKYGVQSKNNSDVEKDDFANKTVSQIQDSRQHGLKKLFVVLAADITGNSNLQKVRIFQGRICAMNDPYVEVVSPERAWSLLFPASAPG